MPVTRAPLKLSAVPAGIGLGACVWFVLGGANPPVEIGRLQDRLAAAEQLMRPSRSFSREAPGAIAQAQPIFVTATNGAGGEPSLVLQGLSLGAGDKRALIAIGGAAPVWLGVGESRSGVTLRRVDASGALVETFSGDRSLTLGANAASASPTPPSGAGVSGPPTLPTAVR